MTAIVLVGSLVYSMVNFLKRLSGRDWNGVVTQLVAWVGGIIAVVLVVHSGLASEVPVVNSTLGALNGWGQVVAGLMASSLFGLIHDAKQAVDGSDTSKEPPLVPPASTPTP